MQALLIYGAGAIGRGYVPWIFSPNKYSYSYVETKDDLRNSLNHRKKFTTFKIVDGRYESMEVTIEQCYNLGEEKEKVGEVDAIVTAIGSRNIPSIVGNLKGSYTPIICFENDPSICELLISKTGNPNVAFGIPDTICSNTAPDQLKNKDPLSLVTEDGTCYIDHSVSWMRDNCVYADENLLGKQWIAKLYLHNTPHCVTAYLGHILSVTYVHEALLNKNVEKIVNGVLDETKELLTKRFNFDEHYVEWYANKELKRFRNPLLCDPISRVAREPLRKLGLNERLIGAAKLCIECVPCITPTNIIRGIVAAFYYDNPVDCDSQKIKFLMRSLEPTGFLEALGLRPHEQLHKLILDEWVPSFNDMMVTPTLPARIVLGARSIPSNVNNVPRELMTENK